jgi:hypothetical protein
MTQRLLFTSEKALRNLDATRLQGQMLPIKMKAEPGLKNPVHHQPGCLDFKFGRDDNKYANDEYKGECYIEVMFRCITEEAVPELSRNPFNACGQIKLQAEIRAHTGSHFFCVEYSHSTSAALDNWISKKSKIVIGVGTLSQEGPILIKDAEKTGEDNETIMVHVSKAFRNDHAQGSSVTEYVARSTTDPDDSDDYDERLQLVGVERTQYLWTQQGVIHARQQGWNRLTSEEAKKGRLLKSADKDKLLSHYKTAKKSEVHGFHHSTAVRGMQDHMREQQNMSPVEIDRQINRHLMDNWVSQGYFTKEKSYIWGRRGVEWCKGQHQFSAENCIPEAREVFSERHRNLVSQSVDPFEREPANLAAKGVLIEDNYYDTEFIWPHGDARPITPRRMQEEDPLKDVKWCRLSDFGHSAAELGAAVVFDTTNPCKSNCGRVFQGELDNAYFVEALNAVSCRPKLARQLFYC